jgi:hypothetical protein
MSELYIVDSKSGLKNPSSWYINPQMLQVMDNNSTRLLLHEITQMEARFAEFEMQGLSFPEMCSVVPIESGFDYVGYKQQIKTGQAEFLSRNATSFPKATSGLIPNITPVIPIGICYQINYFEEASARRFGMSVDADGMMMAAEFIDQKLDEAFHFGGRNPDNLEIKGLVDYLNGGADAQINAGTSVHKVTLGTGQSGNTWALKTGREILEDVGNLIAAVWVNSSKRKRANKLAMGLNAWQQLNKKTLLTEEGTVARLLPYLEATYGDVRFVVDPYLDRINFTGTANETWDGQAGSSAVIAYEDAPTNIQFRASRREILRPYEYSGFTTTVNTFGLTAGTQIKNTYSMAYMKGID